MTSKRERYLLMLISLLEEESQCLRSVLSEFNEEEKVVFIQYTRSKILREAIETLEFKL